MSMDFMEQNELLKAIIEQQKAQIQLQETRIQEKDETIKELRALVDELRSLKANLEETINEFRRSIYGVSSEKTRTKRLTSKEEETSQPSPSEETKKITVKSHTRERKGKSKREDMYANLPIKEVICKVPEDQRRCNYCNTEMILMGTTFVREEIQITPARIERVHYKQEVLICPECKKDGDGTIVKAKTPSPLLMHSPASPSIVAYIMYHKSYMNTPYYRQEPGMAQLGLTLPRETMANWYIYCAQHYFYPLYIRMHEHLLQREIIHADETTCQILREENKPAESTSYMWIFVSGSDDLPKIVMYEYQSGRSGSYAKEFLNGFHGMLQCDGYQGYNKVEDVILVCCLAHCRRKFYEAIPAERKKRWKLLDINSEVTIKEPEISEEDFVKLIPAEVGLLYCNKLFYQERKLKELTSEERKLKRLELETPIWENFWNWIAKVKPLGGSKLEKAVNYAFNHRETLSNYLLDGRCEISNNAAERRAKSYAIGRKNFLFHTSVAGAKASAIMYSMIETAKANNLNVFQYLYIVLTYMPDYKNEPAGIEMLLPWSDFIKEHCTGLIDVETITPENHEALPLK